MVSALKGVRLIAVLPITPTIAIVVPAAAVGGIVAAVVAVLRVAAAILALAASAANMHSTNTLPATAFAAAVSAVSVAPYSVPA